MKILIQGAGIAGLTLARELNNRGMDYLVVEKAQALKPIGAGITLASNALKCLKHTMDIGALRERGQSLELMCLLSDNGEELSALPTRLPEDEFDGMALHRYRLHEALLEGLDATKLRLGVTITEFQCMANEVHAVLSDGSTIEADYLVGADGIKSEIRGYVDPTAQIVFSGYTCWRAVVKHTLAHEQKSVEVWGRGKRLGYIQIAPDEIYVYLTLNVSISDYTKKKTQRSNKKVRLLFSEFQGECASIVQLLNDDVHLIHNDIEELMWHNWSKDRVVLIGDAAHAMTPNLGQGAAMGIEDAYALAKIWSEDPSPSSLKYFEKQRHPRIKFMQKESRRTGSIGQWDSMLAICFRRWLVKNTPEFLNEYVHKTMFTFKI